VKHEIQGARILGCGYVHFGRLSAGD